MSRNKTARGIVACASLIPFGFLSLGVLTGQLQMSRTALWAYVALSFALAVIPEGKPND